MALPSYEDEAATLINEVQLLFADMGQPLPSTMADLCMRFIAIARRLDAALEYLSISSDSASEQGPETEHKEEAS